VGDRDNHAIRRIDLSSSTVCTVAGGNGANRDVGSVPAASAHFNSPCGLALDSTGKTIYVADSGNNQIRSIALP
jgi:DNA-binding beta-propeller fold protein YncE